MKIIGYDETRCLNFREVKDLEIVCYDIEEGEIPKWRKPKQCFYRIKASYVNALHSCFYINADRQEGNSDFTYDSENYIFLFNSLEKANEVFLKLISLIKNDTMDLRGSQYLMTDLSEEHQQVTVFNDIDYDLSDIPLSVRIVEE